MHTILLLLCFVISGLALSGELEQAYQKEFAYLVAERIALEKRLSDLKATQEQNLAKIEGQIDAQQKAFLTKQNQIDRLNRQIVEASRDADFVDNDAALLETTLSQAQETLKKLGIQIDEGASKSQVLEQALEQANKQSLSDGQLLAQSGQFYLSSGESVEGQLFSVGRIAKYGVSENGGGILAPAGNGQFKVWDNKTKSMAQQLSENLYPQQLDIFLFESIDKGIEKQAEKTLTDDVRAGGMVGEVIIGLGILGIVFVIFRILILSRAGSRVHKVANRVNEQIANGDMEGAISYCKKRACAASKVIGATLRNIKRDRDHIEDIISESILNQSSQIDRFGAAILVIAAVSPLLGLLGTVTGMISTFDIITEFGTGDPKMLSSGISEALVTTKFGLVAAIPLLLCGNLLTAWARRIKADLEQAALHMINTHR